MQWAEYTAWVHRFATVQLSAIGWPSFRNIGHMTLSRLPGNPLSEQYWSHDFVQVTWQPTERAVLVT